MPDRDTMAAEFVLGVLDGETLDEARSAYRADPAFRDAVDAWLKRFLPLLHAVPPVEPSGDLWRAIEAALPIDPMHRSLQRQLSWWRRASVAATALAATLAGILLLRPAEVAPPAPPTISRPAPMVAMLGEDGETKVVANWDPGSRRLVLTVTGNMPADDGMSHELWVMPERGPARSLGTMGKDAASRMELADALARLLQQGATIAVTVEPPGGSPSGAPTGPMIASGQLVRA